MAFGELTDGVITQTDISPLPAFFVFFLIPAGEVNPIGFPAADDFNIIQASPKAGGTQTFIP